MKNNGGVVASGVLCICFPTGINRVESVDFAVV